MAAALRGPTMIERRFDFGFAVDWMRKDLAIAMAEGKRAKAMMPLVALVDQGPVTALLMFGYMAAMAGIMAVPSLVLAILVVAVALESIVPDTVPLADGEATCEMLACALREADGDRDADCVAVADTVNVPTLSLADGVALADGRAAIERRLAAAAPGAVPRVTDTPPVTASPPAEVRSPVGLAFRWASMSA